MPPFPERESSILAKLKKKRPDKVSALLEPKAPGRTAATENDKIDQTPQSSVSAPTTASVQNHVSTRSDLALITVSSFLRDITCHHAGPSGQILTQETSSSSIEMNESQLLWSIPV